MPQDKDFKRLVRQRMTQTNERYTDARTAILSGPGDAKLDPKTLRWVSMLAEVAHAERAHSQLIGLPEEQRRRAAIAGLSHESWRVRRRCAQILDHLALTDETILELKNLLKDPNSKVRQAALHSLICKHCKPEECAVAIRPIAESMLNDPSAGVRKQALGGIASWTGDVFDDGVVTILTEKADSDQSDKVRELARAFLKSDHAKRQGNAKRLALPARVRAKVDRHSGKWVAVSDGTVIGVDEFTGAIRRTMNGPGKTDATICWVPSTLSRVHAPA